MIKRKVLVTGANGFIGSHVTRRLVAEGGEVAVIKRRDGDTTKLKDVLSHVQVYETDLRDTDGVSKAVAAFRPEVIFHLATYYVLNHKPHEIPLMVDTNVLGTINLLEAAKESGVKLFVNTSSCFTYQQGREPLREDSPLAPINLYALTKVQAENACAFYARTYGLPAVTLRIFSPYGPGDHQRRLIPYVIKSFFQGEPPKMTTGKQRWDFVYVDDIVDAYMKILSVASFSQPHEAFNVGTGEAVSVYDIGRKLQEILESEIVPLWGAIPHRDNELWFVCADIARAKTVLGWEPRVKILEDGLNLTAEYFKGMETLRNVS